MSGDSERPDDAGLRQEVADWWATSVSRIEPGVIELRGHPIQELLGAASFTDAIWLMLHGELPAPRQAELLDAALVGCVDHGPHAPSIAVARMTATCGVGLNNAVASGVNAMGDVHGGAGQQCLELYAEILARVDEGVALAAATRETIARRQAHSKYLPGFGHRFHPRDPRRDPHVALVRRAVDDGVVEGRFLAAGLAVEAAIAPVPMNIDGSTAIIYGELGFPAPLARGLFVLARTVGILAHAWEEMQGGRRIKGPIPPGVRPTYRPPTPF
ncbi:citryl-CoA lyase [Dactylosporangium sp. CS-033363]|uniref:citryl-CoA lyase n=1 Tax=Dactylosporangium sp. CS-033363 TaxID=3239935 RepID=UPI003D9073F6